ncbi:DUF4230 domain-containing protein [Mumia zhuanghuii]|uniref:DUF4230 domain-containing protein n=1 Tax=Mumia zhuanghuii TaxID=2585211 RepID=A0A5C4MJZ9_9ACTN|nr:DUF4230 domain-containing protein [Mumia zhuanghuii]TNC42432.1 DUF4230 domain-containing protein [Mumia zhuanghuii]TNC43722.1 DUF4230 domain-containing protein [Mumia zhuanghuii]
MRTALKVALSAVAGGLAIVLVIAALSVGGLLTNPFQSRTTDRSQPALLKSIQNISQYHAAVGNFEVVLDIEKDIRWVPDFVVGERSLFVAAGTVNAYVDFSGLSEDDLTLSGDGQSVKVRLPEAQLDEPNLDQDRTYLFSQERGVVNRVNDALSARDQSGLYELAEDKLEAAAKKSELTKRAEENTKAMLVGMFGSLDIEATFVDAEE